MKKLLWLTNSFLCGF